MTCALLCGLALIPGVPGNARVGEVGASANEVQLEEVVAPYLGGLVRNVTWPAEALPPNRPIRIGIMAEDAVYATIARGLAGEGEARRFEAVPVRGPDDVAACHAVFLHNPKSEAAARILAAAGRKPILTILYSADRTVRGGIVEFFIIKSTVRYLLNARELRRSELRSSPELVQFSLLTPPR